MRRPPRSPAPATRRRHGGPLLLALLLVLTFGAAQSTANPAGWIAYVDADGRTLARHPTTAASPWPSAAPPSARSSRPGPATATASPSSSGTSAAGGSTSSTWRVATRRPRSTGRPDARPSTSRGPPTTARSRCWPTARAGGGARPRRRRAGAGRRARRRPPLRAGRAALLVVVAHRPLAAGPRRRHGAHAAGRRDRHRRLRRGSRATRPGCVPVAGALGVGALRGVRDAHGR